MGLFTQKEKWIGLLDSSDKIMFCIKCKDHFVKYKEENPLHNEMLSTFEWTYHLHNSVNIKLDKRVIPLDEAKNEWIKAEPLNTSTFNSSILRSFINAYSTQVGAFEINLMDYVNYYLDCMEIVYVMPDKAMYLRACSCFR